MQRLVLTQLYRLRSFYRRVFQPLTLGVRCIVVRADGHVLLVRHTYLPGWYLPGGGVEKGETLEEAAIRELDEEVGVTPSGRPVLFHAYSNFTEHKCDHIALYEVRDFAIRPNPNFEIAEHGFFDPDALPETTSRATLRRLMEWRGLEAPSSLW